VQTAPGRAALPATAATIWVTGFRGFDLFAPLLAQRYRVVAIDARGHGDSDGADSYILHTGH
jgi:pimeloyl-ACP methyl ester carboxylesterase